jgi:tetratricopeptide repeat protein
MVNYYFDLNVKERNVSFRRIWYVLNANSEFKLKSEFQNNKNWPLRALFWLSKELYDKDFAFTLDPKAKELDDMRNALEHRALRIQDYKTTDPYLGESIVRDELQERTLRIFKLVRSAIIYLSLAINFEERRRSVEKGVNKSLIGEIELNSVRDDRKR